jgi:DUF1365 family protein
MKDDALSESTLAHFRLKWATLSSTCWTDLGTTMDRLKDSLQHFLPTNMAKDLKVLAALLLIMNYKHVLSHPSTLPVEYLICTLAAMSFWMVWRFLQSPSPSGSLAAAHDTCVIPSGLGPRFFESSTTHARLYPTRHSFAYSYLMVGIPIGRRGSVGSILASDPVDGGTRSRQQKWFFSVHADDYLEKSHCVDGLRGKLRAFLKSHDVSLEGYPYAYLVTAPRFCGFSFNPVSFWYLYDQNKHLNAMIVEVNNTFDERRMYFLPGERKADEGPSSASSRKFHNQWDKDFHVSPFNDRDGSYSLSAIDPFEHCATTDNRIDNTIVLNSPEGKPKIVTRIFSTHPGIDPVTMSVFQSARFIARWWWVSFMTNPRILREARVLWVKRLQVFYRSEVLISSIGRTETAEETKIEGFFCRLLQRLVDVSKREITYSPAAGPERGRAVTIRPMETSSAEPESEPQPENHPLDIKIMTPAFYAEIARDPDVRRTLDRLCFDAAPGQAMVHVSDLAGFRQLLERFGAHLYQRQEHSCRESYYDLNNSLRPGDSMFRIAVKALRGTAPTASAADDSVINFDAFVQASFPQAEACTYAETCLKILLADRLALGYTRLLAFYADSVWFIALLATCLQINGLFIHRTTECDLWNLMILGSELGMVCVSGTLRGW